MSRVWVTAGHYSSTTGADPEHERAIQGQGARVLGAEQRNVTQDASEAAVLHPGRVPAGAITCQTWCRYSAEPHCSDDKVPLMHKEMNILEIKH